MSGLTEGVGFGTTEITVARANSRILNRFLFYVLTEDRFKQLGKSAMTGAGGLKRVPDLFTKDFSFPLPSLAEQQQIIAFLDHETSQIDDLIGKQERLIELLAEKRQASITHAVTKGLDPTAPTKPSGIPWLGAIPAHWTQKPMCHYMAGRVDYRGATPKKTDDGIFLVTAKNVRKGFIDYSASTEYVAVEDYDSVMSRGIPAIGDILMTMEAPLGNFALIDDPKVALAQRVIKFRPKAELVPAFAAYAANSPYFQAQLEERATGSTALGLKASKLIELRLTAPSRDEQQRIVDFLDTAVRRIDGLMQRAKAGISLLLERRSALISAAVTGKIDVREGAAWL
ncbi:restriction endonuclease subunit S [Arthrobacter sp. UYCo732]|uniref:restriction endonuclease subunit S n=1 Tax=Arthrobacter sp. UYCo732 TaxID=3156336 RepID=UPI0033992E03